MKIPIFLGILRKNPAITFLNDVVRKVNTSNGKVRSLSLGGRQRVFSEKILLANGAFSQELIDTVPELDNTMPKIFSGVGYAVLAEQNQERPVKHVIRTPNRAGACGLHVLPREKDTLYVGASNDLAFIPQKTPKVGMFNFLLECLIDQIDQNLCGSSMVGHHVGNRPASLDSFPMIGELSIENFFLATGTYRDGFHQSPLIADHLSAILLGKKPKISDLFKPQRPLIQVKNKEESIKEYLVHFQGSSYEHQMSLPLGILSDQEYLNIVQKRVEILYSNFGTEYGLSPDILFMFDLDKTNQKRIAEIGKHIQKIGYVQAEVIKKTFPQAI